MPRYVSKTTAGHVQPILGKGDVTIDAWGRPKFVNDLSLFHGMFTFNLPHQMWIVLEDEVENYAISTSTRATSVDGALSLKSGPTLGNSTALVSKRHPRYQPNRGLLYSSSIFLKNKFASASREFGLSTKFNGAFFKLKSDGNLYACLMSDTVLVREEKINIPFENFDVEKGNIYDIQLQWRGVGNISFFIGNPNTGVSELVHRFDLLGKLDGLSMVNPSLPLWFKSVNEGDEAEIGCGCADVSAEGGHDGQEFYNSTTHTITASANSPFYAFRVADLVNGKKNTRDVDLARIIATADKKATLEVYIGRDPSGIVGGTWVNINGGFTEYNSTITGFDDTKMRKHSSRVLQALEPVKIDNPQPDKINMYLIHEDYLVLYNKANTNIAYDFTIEWGEEI